MNKHLLQRIRHMILSASCSDNFNVSELFKHSSTDLVLYMSSEQRLPKRAGGGDVKQLQFLSFIFVLYFSNCIDMLFLLIFSSRTITGGATELFENHYVVTLRSCNVMFQEIHLCTLCPLNINFFIINNTYTLKYCSTVVSHMRYLSSLGSKTSLMSLTMVGTFFRAAPFQRKKNKKTKEE